MSTIAPLPRRPRSAGDEAFLHALYASTRTDEMSVTGWSEAEVSAFLEMQFRARETSYRTQFPGAEEAVFLHDGGRPLGAAIIYREPSSVLLVDLAFLPEARGAGRGTRFVRELLREAAAAGRVVRLHVLRGSRALAFYGRLGFRVVEDDDDVYLGLESPGPAPSPRASPPGPLP